MEDVYQVYKPYRLPNPKDTVLPIGQLVEVLDDSGMNWLVSTIADNSEEESMEVFVPKLCLRKYTKGENILLVLKCLILILSSIYS